MICRSHLSAQRRGSAMIAVFWLMSILALAIFAAVRVVKHDIDVVVSITHGSRALHMANRGVAVGVHPNVKPGDPLCEFRSEEDSEEGYSVRITKEAKRFNINSLLLRRDEELLERMFGEWGLEELEAQSLMHALMDWVDGNDNEELTGAEADYYLEQGQPNFPYNRPFYDLDEMRLVRGMAQLEELRPDWRNWFTIWSGGRLEINHASADLIAMAADVPWEDARDAVEQIRGPDGIRFTDDDQEFDSIQALLNVLGVVDPADAQLNSRFTNNDPTTRIESIGMSHGARRKITLILRNRTGRPAIYQRMEEIVP